MSIVSANRKLETRIDTYVLAHHVEAQIFQCLKVVFHRFAVRRRVETIRPVALVKSTELEHKFAVE